MYQDFLGFELSALNTVHFKCYDVCANVSKCDTYVKLIISPLYYQNAGSTIVISHRL